MRRAWWSAMWGTAIAACVALLPALGGKLLADDAGLLVFGLDVRKFRGLGRLVSEPILRPDTEPASRVVRPLAAALDWTSWQLVRADPALQHAIGIALHVVAAVLLVRVLRRRGATPGAAWAGALLFAVHPVAVATAAPVVGRSLVLGALVLAWALAPPRGESARAAFVRACLAGAAATLAHEEYAGSFLLFGFGAQRRVRLAGAALGCAVGVALGARPSLDVSVFGGVGALARRALSVVFGMAEASYGEAAPAASPAWLALVLLVAVLPFVVLRRQSGRWLALGAAAFAVLSLVVAASEAARAETAPDRFVYPMLLGLALAYAPLLDRLPRSVRTHRFARFAAPALAVGLVPLDAAAALTWHDDTTVTTAMARGGEDPEERLAGALLREAEAPNEAWSVCAEYAATRAGSTRAHGCAAAGARAAGSGEDALALARRFVVGREHVPRARHEVIEALLATRRVAEAAALVETWAARFGEAPDLLAARAAIRERRP